MNELKELEVEEVSLVDAGANPEAKVVMYKRDAVMAENEAIVAKLDELNKRLEVEIEKRETEALRKVAAKYELIGENVDDLTAILKAAQGTPLYDKMIATLDKLYDAEQVKFEEIGKSGTNTRAGDIEKIAADIQKANPALTKRQAIEKAFAAHPELEY